MWYCVICVSTRYLKLPVERVLVLQSTAVLAVHAVLGATKYDTELVDLFGSNSLVEEYINI